MEIRSLIADLLIDHDCVIIPGFGGFIGNYCAARIDPVNHTFNPPSKELLFNVNLKHNDGLLAHLLSTTYEISYSEALERISKFATETMAALQAGEHVNFPRVGKLSAGREGNIQFEQQRSINLLADSYGLESFISPPVNPAASHRKRALKIKTKKHGFRIPFGFPVFRRWAAILTVPVVLGGAVMFLHFGRTKGIDQNNAGILSNVFSGFSYASLFEKKVAPTSPALAEAARTIEKPVIEENTLPQSTTVETNDKKDEISADAGSLQFAVIVGAFRNQENAAKLVTELKAKGADARIYDRSSGGLYRVSMNTFTNRDQAKQFLTSIQQDAFPGAWLLVK